MALASRPLILAGAALVGAGLIAPTPVTPALPHVAPPAVQLTADSDFFTLWADVLDRAFTNVTNLGTELVTPPLPILQQVVVNQANFLQDFLNNPSDIWNIFGQMWGNLVAGVSAPFVQPDLDNLDTLQSVAYLALSGLMGTILPDNPELGQWVLDFSTTSLGGWIIGEVGTFVSPWLELYNSLGDMFDSIRADDWAGAWNDLINIPAHMTDGWLNGYGPIDLTELAQDLDVPGLVIRSLSFDLPGLLNSAGTLFGSVSADVCAGIIAVGRCVGIPISMDGSPSGPLGSLISLSHTIAEALGWDGTGNPIDALLTGSTAADAVAGSDAFGTMWQDLLNAIGL